MVSKRGFALALVGLFAVASLAHYALFGALPFGKPAMLENDDIGTTEPDGTAA